MYIEPYITDSEYRCRCCGEYPPSFRDSAHDVIFNAFKQIREAWGKPIPITSGYRCPTHNSMIGGAYLSAHMFGLALDLDCVDDDEVLELSDCIDDTYPDLRKREYTGDSSFIHIDCAYYIYPKASHAWVEGYRWTG